MPALINPCDITVTNGQNTGVECSAALGVAKGIFIVPANATWTEADMVDPYSFFRAKIHAAGSSRFFPVLKGIFDFAIGNESDITEANPITGTNTRLRAGGFTLTYTFEEGGLCLAKALLGFQGKGYRFVPVDQDSQFIMRKNSDGTYSGLKSSDITSSIIPASASAKFKNTLVLGVSQNEYIEYAELLKSDTDISDFNGLTDSIIFKAAAATTPTGSTAPTRTVTITAIGADSNTINVGYGSGAVIKTAAETTTALLATKIKNAINAATSTNGGYTATDATSIITISAPAGIGASLNGTGPAPIIVGTITATSTNFVGGVTGTAILKVGIRTECAKTNLITIYGAVLANLALYVVTNKLTGAVVTPSGVSLVAGVLEFTGPFISGQTYIVKGTAPSVWLGLDIVGYDASDSANDILIP